MYNFLIFHWMNNESNSLPFLRTCISIGCFLLSVHFEFLMGVWFYIPKLNQLCQKGVGTTYPSLSCDQKAGIEVTFGGKILRNCSWNKPIPSSNISDRLHAYTWLLKLIWESVGNNKLKLIAWESELFSAMTSMLEKIKQCLVLRGLNIYD